MIKQIETKKKCTTKKRKQLRQESNLNYQS